jgi:hypothetical protein
MAQSDNLIALTFVCHLTKADKGKRIGPTGWAMINGLFHCILSFGSLLLLSHWPCSGPSAGLLLRIGVGFDMLI